MEPFLKVIMTMDLSMAMGCLVGPMGVDTVEDFRITTLKDVANTTGQMAVAILGDGMIIKCMVTEIFSGLTVDNTQVLIVMIQKWDLVYSDGQMDDDMREIGKKENNTGKENLYPFMENHV